MCRRAHIALHTTHLTQRGQILPHLTMTVVVLNNPIARLPKIGQGPSPAKYFCNLWSVLCRKWKACHSLQFMVYKSAGVYDFNFSFISIFFYKTQILCKSNIKKIITACHRICTTGCTLYKAPDQWVEWCIHCYFNIHIKNHFFFALTLVTCMYNYQFLSMATIGNMLQKRSKYSFLKHYKAI